MSAITFGILTVSDTCFHDNSKDESGPEAERLVTDPNTETGRILKGKISCKKILPDEQHSIMRYLVDWSDKEKVNVILTSGGTGFSERDVTPEATKKVIDKEAPGMALAMLNKSLEVTPKAMLSRAVCGIRLKTLIVNLPGSPKAVRECLSVIAPVIPHAVALILNDERKVQEEHSKIEKKEKPSDELVGKIKNLEIKLENVARRLRESPYPMVSLKKAVEILTDEDSSRYLSNNESPEYVASMKSHGRVLARTINSEYDLPPFEASMKDGYAVIASDGAGPRSVLAGIEAGHEPGSVHLRSGECARVNTGAPLPDGATAVVQVEDTALSSVDQTGRIETMIDILVAPKVGQDIRRVGSDVKKDDFVLAEGTRVGATELGILAGCGVSKVPLTKVPIVGVLSTGNELQGPGEVLKRGRVYDSNKITLITMLKENGYDSTDLGIVEDNPRAMFARVESAFKMVDVLITTGSVSMGDKDMLKLILKEVFGATIHFGRVNLKPGKPTTFATCQYDGKKKWILGLPGNPVSAFVTAHLFAVPLLHRLSGNHSKPTIVTAELEMDLPLDSRPEYARANLEWKDEGIPRATITGNQTSSRLLSCKRANAFLMLPEKTEGKSTLKKGDRVSAMLIGFDNASS